MLQGEYRGSVIKIGPRAVTFVPPTQGHGAILPALVTNCSTCPIPTGAQARGEDGENGTAALLPHGWYVLETDTPIFWQQIRPKQACDANPLLHGRRLEAGGWRRFFVTGSDRDGVIAVFFCFNPAGLPALCDPAQTDRPEGVVRITRDDTVWAGSETDDDAGKIDVPAEPGVCQS